MGVNEQCGTVYIIDYGLVKRYRSLKTHQHIPLREGKKLIGTARYASVHTHTGLEQSRRDDLECLGYSLLYLLKGSLPWQGLMIEDKPKKYARILKLKLELGVDELCKDLPIEFARYMYYCRELQFESKPDYTQLRSQFKECLQRLYGDKETTFDWQRLKIDPTKKWERESSSSSGSRNAASPSPDASPVAGTHDRVGSGELQRILDDKRQRLEEIQKLMAGLPSKTLQPTIPKSGSAGDFSSNADRTAAASGETKSPQKGAVTSAIDQSKGGIEEARSAGPTVYVPPEEKKLEEKSSFAPIQEETKAAESVAILSVPLMPKSMLKFPIAREYTDGNSCNLNLPDIAESPPQAGTAQFSTVLV